jgi:hypothetical protein
MSAELKFAQERLYSLHKEARIVREINAARNQDKNAQVFKLQLPRFFGLSRKHA